MDEQISGSVFLDRAHPRNPGAGLGEFEIQSGGLAQQDPGE
jgi:hypothetical protein